MRRAILLLLGILAPRSPARGQDVEVAFERLEPEGERGGAAIVLIHGFRAHPFSDAQVHRALRTDWQSADGALGRALAPLGDLFALSYAQDASIDEIAGAPDAEGLTLADHARRLRAEGYERVVLIGHSAGGLVARQLVEDDPSSGVTQVIQVAAPNEGSGWGALERGVRASQEPFVRSLSGEARAARRALGKRIPEEVSFAVVVAAGAGAGDLVVRCESQWPPDLRDAGIPAIRLTTTHFTVMRSPWTAEAIASLVERPPAREVR